MATAQILIGNPHPNRGGITAIHKIDLTEGSRPAWNLHSVDHSSVRTRSVVWIPTIEHMLDDALLMAAIHAFQSEPIRSMFSSFSDKIDESRLELYEDLTSSQRQHLYKQCRELEDFPKVVVMLFEDSCLNSYIGVIADYRMECEVLMPIYTRLYSNWTRETMINGELHPPRMSR